MGSVFKEVRDGDCVTLKIPNGLEIVITKEADGFKVYETSSSSKVAVIPQSSNAFVVRNLKQ